MTENRIFRSSATRRLQRRANAIGLQIVPSRTRKTHADDLGGFMLKDLVGNRVVAGSRFEMDLADLETEIAAQEANHA